MCVCRCVCVCECVCVLLGILWNTLKDSTPEHRLYSFKVETSTGSQIHCSIS